MEAFQLDLASLLNDKEHPVWDRPVPIRYDQALGTYECYITGAIEDPFNYNELCYVLEQAAEGEVAVLHINTYGGIIDSAFKIIASIKRSKAKVVARLTGTVASAGTIIALCCDDVEVEDFTHFMIHNYSTGTQGKGHEIMEYVNFNDKDLKKTFTQLYSGFLSTREINEVIKGKDMWLTAEQVRERWAKKQEKDDG
ncbi:putative Clp protease [Roseobacter phage CRP-143]|nr:putative Clp protease [Roseobacter phage CRP-143]